MIYIKIIFEYRRLGVTGTEAWGDGGERDLRVAVRTKI
jgi:hypothetical protein